MRLRRAKLFLAARLIGFRTVFINTGCLNTTLKQAVKNTPEGKSIFIQLV